MPWSQIFTSQICLLTLFAYISEFTVVCVVTDVLYMCLIHVKGEKNTINMKKKDMKRIIKSDPCPTPLPPKKKIK